MKRSILITILSLVMGWSSAGAAAPQSEKSQTIVYIGGQKFYIHTVKQGDTLYSLARLYGVAEQTLLDHNPTLADVIKIDQNIKIPLPQPQPQPEKPLTAKEEKKLRRKYLLHTIEAHETLFAISRRYGISVETLMKDNKDLDPAHLTIGSTLLVRKKEVGKTSNAENLAELERYKERLNSVTAADSCRYYVVRPGDTIVICELTRLSRSVKDLFDLVEQIEKIGANIRSVKEPWLDTTTPQGRLLFTIFSGVSQFERDLTHERTMEGLASARARGRLGGRPKKDGKIIDQALTLYDSRAYSVAEILKTTGISRRTLYKYINMRKEKKE